MIKLTQAQIDKIRKDLAIEIRDINKLKISEEDKIYLAGELSEAYKKGFETGAGEPFDTNEVDIVFAIDKNLAMLSEKVSKVAPGVRAEKEVKFMIFSFWRDIIKVVSIIIDYFHLDI